MVVMGRIAAAYGIHGWIKVQPFTEYVESLLEYPAWWIGKEQGPWREVEVEQCEVHGKSLVAQLPLCPDRTAAEKLKGLLVAVPRSSLPKEAEGEYYWSDLIGLTVVNEADVTLGTVANLLETGANEVLVVRGDGSEILIPFVASAIKLVDLKNGRVLVDWSADYLK